MDILQMRIFQYKSKLNLTNKEIARRSGFSVATIDRIASGKIKAPKLSTIRKIAEVFSCSVEDLTGQETLTELSYKDNKIIQFIRDLKENSSLLELIKICQGLSDDEIRTVIGMIKMMKQI